MFPPVLIAAYGERWFEDGCLSLYFRHATTDGEAVRASLIVDDTGRASVSLVTPDGIVVAEGTASVGNAGPPSALMARDLRHDHTDLRIMARLEKGEVIGPAIGECSAREQSARVHAGLVASPIEWYHGTSPWGSAVAAPSSVMEMFTDVVAEFLLPRVAHAR